MTVQAPLVVTYTESHHVTERPAVIVSIGRHEVAVLNPCREWQMGEDEFAIAAETVMPYLRRLFVRAEGDRHEPDFRAHP